MSFHVSTIGNGNWKLSGVTRKPEGNATETKDLKALALRVLHGNAQGNSPETAVSQGRKLKGGKGIFTVETARKQSPSFSGGQGNSKIPINNNNNNDLHTPMNKSFQFSGYRMETGKPGGQVSMAVKVYSEALHAYLWVIQDDAAADALQGQGEPTYAAQEIRELKGKSLEHIKVVHEAKRIFEGSKVIRDGKARGPF